MAVELTVIGKIVLCTRHGLHVNRVIAHHAAHESARHGCNQEGILTVALARTAPTRVADWLYNRTPEGKSLGAGLEYGTGLIGYDRRLQLHQVGIPCSAQRHTAGKRCGALQTKRRIGTRHYPVQSLAPDIIVAYAKTRNCGHIVAEQSLLLLKSKTRHQVNRSLFE
ncbi:MAG: hypothetical protein BWY95_02694 [Bacteroidetes bacterium ADurb.BinA104]|nr:MAG: hypothetical protein BWY95_02694 [Bacteroidetes bacterium ADurb.BinA104]